MTSEKKPLISILVCNYNYDKYIIESLESAVAQDYPNTEIIIVDDGSKDNSVTFVEKFISDHPEKVVKLNAKAKNQGLCYARNDAIEMSSGEYFVFLDSDDSFPEDYISKLFSTITAKNADAVYGDAKRFGDEDRITDEIEFNPEELLTHNFINISTLVKRSSIKNNRFDTHLNREILEDYDFWLGLSLSGCKIVKSKNTYLNYRIQNDSRNKNEQTMKDQILSFVDIWVYIIDKYKLQYPKTITNDIYLKQLRFQISNIGRELDMLNQNVQNELLPELNRRAEHIEHQVGVIDHLESTNEKLVTSASYRTGELVTKPLRKLKKIVKR